MSYYDLGTYSRPITTTSPEAQIWFDRGLTWVFAFNHEEAIKCFQKALEHDPDCAMAHWGVAYASGPNYNLPWELYGSQRQGQGAGRFLRCHAEGAGRVPTKATPVEQALIGALPVRYPQRDPPPTRRHDRCGTRPTPARCATCSGSIRDDLDVALRLRRGHHERDALADVGPRDRRAHRRRRAPWRRWRCSTRRSRRTPSAWNHPGLLHLYVHLMEMSPFPQRALRAGDRLRELVPDSGHLVHMPTHIDVLCGNYHDVVRL